MSDNLDTTTRGLPLAATLLFGLAVRFEWRYRPPLSNNRHAWVDHSRDELYINGKLSEVFIERPVSLIRELRVCGLSMHSVLRKGDLESVKRWVEQSIAPWNDEAMRRIRYGIREATDSEMGSMTESQKWRYHACAHKPVGMHYENFRPEGQVVRPVYLHCTGDIGDGCGSNQAQLCPFPLDASLRGPNDEMRDRSGSGTSQAQPASKPQ